MAHLEVSTENSIATLTLNRPEARNALSMEMRTSMIDVLHDIEQDSSVRCVVLRGAGDHFLAGGDVKGMAEAVQNSPEEIRKQFTLRIHDLHPMMFVMRRMPQPILASVSGAAAGAGVSIMLCCDLVVAADTSFYTLAYCNIGTSPALYAFSRSLVSRKARNCAITSSRFRFIAQSMGASPATS